VLALAAGSGAQAGSCGWQYCWGAVAMGPHGAYGWAAGQFSEQDAVNVAQAGCGYNCNVLKTFYNTCGALARAGNGGWGFGWTGSRGGAENLALGYCAQRGSNCQVTVWACSQ
jgi:hypothetical protein